MRPIVLLRSESLKVWAAIMITFWRLGTQLLSRRVAFVTSSPHSRNFDSLQWLRRPRSADGATWNICGLTARVFNALNVYKRLIRAWATVSQLLTSEMTSSGRVPCPLARAEAVHVHVIMPPSWLPQPALSCLP